MDKNELLPNMTLEPGYPRSVSVETAQKWMHKLGFEVVCAKKGTFFDGHEREDLVKYRNVFLQKTTSLGFLIQKMYQYGYSIIVAVMLPHLMML